MPEDGRRRRENRGRIAEGGGQTPLQATFLSLTKASAFVLSFFSCINYT